MSHFDFSAIDTPRLFAIAERLVSVETVEDIDAFRKKVFEAAEIFTEAALRILGYDSRSILPEQQAAAVSRAIAEYEGDQKA